MGIRYSRGQESGLSFAVFGTTASQGEQAELVGMFADSVAASFTMRKG
jgi:hypothetical protein